MLLSRKATNSSSEFGVSWEIATYPDLSQLNCKIQLLTKFVVPLNATATKFHV